MDELTSFMLRFYPEEIGPDPTPEVALRAAMRLLAESDVQAVVGILRNRRDSGECEPAVLVLDPNPLGPPDWDELDVSDAERLLAASVCASMEHQFSLTHEAA